MEQKGQIKEEAEDKVFILLGHYAALFGSNGISAQPISLILKGQAAQKLLGLLDP
jgi:hypothetical protein